MSHSNLVRETGTCAKECPRLTYEDYYRAPMELRYELVEGDWRMSLSPGTTRQRISGRLEKALRDWIERHGLGEMYCAPADVLLSEHNVVQPDIFCIRQERLGSLRETIARSTRELVSEDPLAELG
ncbi:MAG TPA: hypothetical protein GXX40_08285 [Firmicutes bacterium]|nr:hypothetical protein [Bacillota bacterium]